MELEQGRQPVAGVDWGFLWHRLKRSPLVLVGTTIVMFVVLIAAAAPVIAPHDPYRIDLESRLLPPGPGHLAGTDEVGRDLLSRIVYGTRASLLVAFGMVFIGVAGGTLLGCFSGLVGGLVDTVIMRLTDIAKSLPGLVVALALAAALGPSLINLAFALGILGIPVYARLARGQTLTLRGKPFVLAARTMGAGTWYILRRHIVPNLAPTILVYASLNMSGAILASAALSFIGVGAQPPTAELGALVNTGRSYILDQWWYSIIPGLVVVAAALGFNLMGDGVRDFLDPKAGAR